MHPALLAMLGVVVVAALGSKRARAVGTVAATKPMPAPPRPAPGPEPLDVKALITLEAERQGLDPRIALAFAELESGFNPNAEGDLDWAFRDGGAKYRDHVWASPRLARNPARKDPSAWHSYGLFQLNAAHFVKSDEHPEVLLDPHVNARRGIGYIKRLVARSNGNLLEARSRYVGCPPGRCSPATQRRLEERWLNSLPRGPQ